MGIFSQWGPKYHEIGLSPIPLSKGKQPAISNWSQYCNRQLTKDELKSFVQNHPDSGIGLACGLVLPNGRQFVAIDIDFDNEEFIDKVCQIVGAKGPAKRGKKGRTIFCLTLPGVQMNSPKIKMVENGKKSPRPVIEVLGTGTQTVIPPSIHPDTEQPYVWLDGDILTDGLNALPTIAGCTVRELILLCEGGYDTIGAINTMTWAGVGGGGDTHEICLSAVGAMIRNGWKDEEIHWRINRAKEEACNRAGEDYSWPDSEKVIQGWIESGRSKGFDEGPIKKIKQRPAEREMADWLNDYYGGEGFVKGVHHRVRQYRDGYWPVIPDEQIKSTAIKSDPFITEAAVRAAVKLLYYKCIDKNFGRVYDSNPLTDHRKHKICLDNGTLNLMTGKLETHNPDNLLMHKLDFEWSDTAECPIFDAFIEQIFGGDQEVIDCILEYFGYTLIPDYSFHKILVLIGPGANGKGTLCNLLKSMHDAAAVGTVSITELKNERMITSLVDKLVNISSEQSRFDSLADTVLKQITGGDGVTTRELFKEPENNVRLFTRLIVQTNEMPSTPDSSDALRRRLIMIPCNYVATQPDPDLYKKLKKERAGVLRKHLLPAIRRMYTQGFITEPAVSKELVDAYLKENNSIEYWVSSYCAEFETGTPTSDLFTAYKDWCYYAGMRYPLNLISWGKAMSRLGYPPTQMTIGDNNVKSRGIRVLVASEF